MISEFVEYVKQVWKNKPNVNSPLNADRLNHMEAGIENNSKKIKETVTAVNELTEKKAEIIKTQKTGTTSDTGSFIISGYPGTLINVLPTTTDLVVSVYIDDSSKSELVQVRDKNGNIYKNNLFGCVVMSMKI